MFISLQLDWIQSSTPEGKQAAKIYDEYPHILRDTEFQCLIQPNTKGIVDAKKVYVRALTACREVIKEYEIRDKNVAANLALIKNYTINLPWITLEIKALNDLIDKEYPQYKNDIEKYRILL